VINWPWVAARNSLKPTVDVRPKTMLQNKSKLVLHKLTRCGQEGDVWRRYQNFGELKDENRLRCCTTTLRCRVHTERKQQRIAAITTRWRIPRRARGETITLKRKSSETTRRATRLSITRIIIIVIVINKW